MNWDDLRIVAAVRDRGTYAGASARLRMDETTVARRVARIQASLGVTLFEAVDGLRRPTEHCEAILAHVHEIARHVAEIGGVGKEAQGVAGRFRIAATPTMAEAILGPRAAGFLLANPGLTLHFLTSDENVNFARWEADFALRLRKPERGNFTITKLAGLRLHMFEPARMRRGGGAPVVCTYPEELDFTPETRHLMARRLHGDARCVTADHRVVYALIRSHRAIGVLPEPLCADLLKDPRLRATPLEERREVWLLVQNHLKRNRSARVVIDWLRDAFGGVSAP